jgi:L-alanine-DL-glutamate epimerase-like enolase superfamily enzyme
VKLEFDVLDLQLAHPWRISRTIPARTSRVVIVKLISASGICGLGEAAPIRRYGESVESVLSFLKKVDSKRLSFNHVRDSKAYLETISSGTPSARCALEVALMDGAAKLGGQPVSDFLGLEFTENKHVTSFTLGIDSPEVMHEKVLLAKDFPIFKIKVGTDDDNGIFKVVREIAPEKTIRADANEGWTTKEQALRAIERLATDGHIEFVEQPLPASTSIADWIWLKERSPLPLIADESYHSAKDSERVAECFHGVNVKLTKAGGITPALEVLRVARKLGLKTMLGCMIETSILISAAAHLAEMCDFIDLDGNLLITNDKYSGVTAENGVLSFASATKAFGLRVSAKQPIRPV